jgi:hypothetical protein
MTATIPKITAITQALIVIAINITAKTTSATIMSTIE